MKRNLPCSSKFDMKRKFNLGKLVFEHILGHDENATYKKALGYLLLIYGILTTQKLDLVTSTNILGPPMVEMRISYKLYKGLHLRDVPSRKKRSSQARKMKGKSLTPFQSQDQLPPDQANLLPLCQRSSNFRIRPSGSMRTCWLNSKSSNGCWSYNSKAFRSSTRRLLRS